MKRTHFHRGASQFYDAEAKSELIRTSDRSIENAQKTRISEQTSRYQPDTKSDTNRIPTTHQPDTKKEYPDTNRIPNERRQTHQPDTNQITTGYQPDNNRIPKVTFSMLVGLQRKIVLIVYDSSCSSGGQISLPLSLDYLRASAASTTGAIKMAIHRLKEKRVLTTQESKKCRGGWSRYRLADSIFLDLQNAVPDSNQITTGYQPDNNQIPIRIPIRIPELPSSSSYLNTNSRTTTTEVARARLEEWAIEDLDYSMLTDIGFGRSQVMQLRSLGIPFDVLQRSLVHFEFELRYTESGKSIKEPLALLMKRLRQNGCWEAPEEYQKRIKHFQAQFEEREKEAQEIASIVSPTTNHESLSS